MTAAMNSTTGGFCSAAPNSPPDSAAATPTAENDSAMPSTYTAASRACAPAPARLAAEVGDGHRDERVHARRQVESETE